MPPIPWICVTLNSGGYTPKTSTYTASKNPNPLPECAGNDLNAYLGVQVLRARSVRRRAHRGALLTADSYSLPLGCPIHMYVYMYVVHTYIQIYVYINMYIYTNALFWVGSDCPLLHSQVYMYVYIYDIYEYIFTIHVCKFIDMCVCVYTYICIYMRAVVGWIILNPPACHYMNIPIYTYVYIYIHTYVYLYIYLYMYKNIYTNLNTHTCLLKNT